MTRHETIRLSRRFDVAPVVLFGAFADETTWRRWFRMPGSRATYAHDFRVGGRDHARSEFRMPDGRVEELENAGIYLAIDPERRIVFAYEARVDGIPRWASLVTVELAPDGEATEVTWTEQVALLHAVDGNGDQDVAHLRGGLGMRLTALGLAVAPDGGTPPS